ncbi:TPA: hypothetical protein ACGVDH_000847 [Enterococcus faecium]|jgi:hypothetical protein|uniref:hypothetical protein n=1 Tax=Enterococcus TaxID=1350 RepID=UPI001CE31B58|nr:MULTISPECIES: hypothetical protein [Enterococcus]MDQ8578675.1 hypothetical protein [Enterococcus faecium]
MNDEAKKAKNRLQAARHRTEANHLRTQINIVQVNKKSDRSKNPRTRKSDSRITSID